MPNALQATERDDLMSSCRCTISFCPDYCAFVPPFAIRPMQAPSPWPARHPFLCAFCALSWQILLWLNPIVPVMGLLQFTLPFLHSQFFLMHQTIFERLMLDLHQGRALTPHMWLSLEQRFPGSAPLCPKISHYPLLNREMMLPPARRPRPERRRFAKITGRPEALNAPPTKGCLRYQPRSTVAPVLICPGGSWHPSEVSNRRLLPVAPKSFRPDYSTPSSPGAPYRSG
jgi:hypothetical protein